MSLDITLKVLELCPVYKTNITHNLTEMADKAGIYKTLWRPEEDKLFIAYQILEPLRRGLARLKEDPEYFKQYNPSNGWGSYEGLVKFIEDYIKAIEEHPTAIIEADR